MSREPLELNDIGKCAVFGSMLAGATIGAYISLTLFAGIEIQSGADLRDAFVGTAFVIVLGLIVGVGIGTPIDFMIGFCTTRWFGMEIGHAALAGTLTGLAFPLFFIAANAEMARGDWSVWVSVVAFAALGAACGAIAHRCVLGKAAG